MTHKADVVICGSGSAGIAAAYYLAHNYQITNIRLIDKQPPLSLTSAKSGENIRNWWPNQPMVDFTNDSITLMEELADQSQNRFNLARAGYAYVTTEPAFNVESYLSHYRPHEVGPIRYHTTDGVSSIPYQPPAGQPYQAQPIGADILLDPSLIQQTFPHFSQAVKAVIHTRRCGSVSAQQLGMYLLEEARKLGVKEHRGEVIEIETDEQGVAAVIVTAGPDKVRVETRCFINAAGPFLPNLAQMLNIKLPVFNVFQQKIAFQDHLNIVPRNTPFTILLDSQYIPWTKTEKADLSKDTELKWFLDEFPGGLHLKPEGGSESSWVKLGWAFNNQPEEPVWERKTMAAYPDLVIRGATKLMPKLAAYLNRLPQPLLHYGGYYTKTKENLPLIGPLPVKGAYVLGALSGFGTMASCAAGELMAAWVTDSKKPAYAGFLSLDRYHNPAYATALAQVSAQGEL